MLDSNFVRRFVMSLSLALAAVVMSGCGGTEENTVVSGQLTPEQEAEADNVTMPEHLERVAQQPPQPHQVDTLCRHPFVDFCFRFCLIINGD